MFLQPCYFLILINAGISHSLSCVDFFCSSISWASFISRAFLRIALVCFWRLSKMIRSARLVSWSRSTMPSLLKLVPTWSDKERWPKTGTAMGGNGASFFFLSLVFFFLTGTDFFLAAAGLVFTVFATGLVISFATTGGTSTGDPGPVINSVVLILFL